VRCYVEEDSKDGNIKFLVSELKSRIFKILSFSMTEWALNSFGYDLSLQIFLMALYQMVTTDASGQVSEKSQIERRAMKT